MQGVCVGLARQVSAFWMPINTGYHISAVDSVGLR
jgi:hypothetical protein